MPSTTQLTVASTERISAGLVRVRFRSDDLSAFAGSTDSDRYVKLVFDRGEGPVLRTYTALEPDVEAGTVAIDFVVHGYDGVAGPWAAQAGPGETLSARGPGGGYAPDRSADWHLLVGDESALPAIGAAVRALPTDAVGYVVVEVPGREHQIDLGAPAGMDVVWVFGADDEAGAQLAAKHPSGQDRALVDAVRALPWRSGRVHAFVHGEAGAVMHGVRPYLLKERGVPRADASISGYWRRGRSEESFRVWKSQLATAESAAG
ncbi:MAG: siderophore-interacting protein [Humibacillus sp.]|nr:siderophore-interacting protein [Humibacillus sp.]MDN5776960.1 siderophore-interacting protein [Humibacillus sp.]